MPGKKRPHNEDVEVANEIYKVARAQADQELETIRGEVNVLREESQAIGALTAIAANVSYNEMLRVITLQRVKQAKEYKKGGLTWDEFCDAVGVPRRSADRMLDELRPIIEQFSANLAGFCGVPFNKIRLLGKSVSANLAGIENGAITYAGETIPITPENAEEIQALIETINEDADKVKEEAKADLVAKDRVLSQKEETINKQEQKIVKLEKQLEGIAAQQGISPDEVAYCKQVEKLDVLLNAYLAEIRTLVECGMPGPTAALRLVALLNRLRMEANHWYQDAYDMHAPADAAPEEEWQQPQ